MSNLIAHPALKERIGQAEFDETAKLLKNLPLLVILVVPPRRRMLGSYHYEKVDNRESHRIKLNSDLNREYMLYILLHELAHYFTKLTAKRNARPHGIEWQKQFSKLLHFGVERFPLPAPAVEAFLIAAQKPGASCQANPEVHALLMGPQAAEPGKAVVNQLAPGQRFAVDGRSFEFLEYRRTRAKCKCISTGRYYLVSGMAVATLIALGNDA